MPLDALRGHREIYHRILRELETRPSHAYLFSGPRGVGKSLTAQGLVHSLVCERVPGENFCCTPDRCPIRAGVGTTETTRIREKGGMKTCECCPACVQTALGVHPDVAHVEKAANRSDVLIEQIRAMMAQLALKPSRAPMRLAILDDAAGRGFISDLPETTEQLVRETNFRMNRTTEMIIQGMLQRDYERKRTQEQDRKAQEQP